MLDLRCVCVLPDGQILVVDMVNKKVKLLDQQFQLGSHCVVTADLWHICYITASEVAVTVDANVSKRQWGPVYHSQE
ncbi:hypothetical protein DPMN_090000 [Dreissena polymorpha]|uniref:Uncharacterized protein n=1 Tax=Dreissena polymorpha TaxID=45954 RepID=A0A9D4KXZ3_DREPO|nr:hypothetical protein DPMN_090000 [Dreissena polymorpha]